MQLLARNSNVAYTLCNMHTYIHATYGHTSSSNTHFDAPHINSCVANLLFLKLFSQKLIFIIFLLSMFVCMYVCMFACMCMCMFILLFTIFHFTLAIFVHVYVCILPFCARFYCICVAVDTCWLHFTVKNS